MDSGRREASGLPVLPVKKLETSKVSTFPSHHPVRPIANKSINQFEIKESLINDITYHDIEKVIEKETGRRFYCKKNPGNTTPLSLEPTTYELEATYASFFRLLAPYHIPATYAVYDEKKQHYVGVVSEEIPGFRSSAEDPLKEEDLQVDFLTKTNLSINEIDKLDETLRQLEEKEELIAKQTTDDNNPEKKAIEIEKINFFTEIKIKHNLGKKNLENFRIIKGLAICFTLSHILMEDDLHQNNFSKYGKRIDFDMSLWPLTYHFKKIIPRKWLGIESLIENYFKIRKQNINQFTVTPEDIEKFPNIEKSQPFYWPTKALSITSHSVGSHIKSALGKSTNPYPDYMNLLYQKLEKNPIFVFFKRKTIAKFVLSDREMYKRISKKHIRRECTFNSRPFIKTLTKTVEDRLALFENAILALPDFFDFIKTHHQQLVTELEDALRKQKIHFPSAKIQQNYLHLNEIIDIKIKSKSKETEKTPSSKQKMLSYEDIKKSLISAKEEHKNPGIMGFYGFFRSEESKRTAKQLNIFAEKNAPENPSENRAAIIRLRDKIEIELNNLNKDGDLYKKLIALLNQINDAFPKPEPHEHKVSCVKSPA